ncbi:hypothetical protein [Mesorhizobium ventifaucium]|uniref:hypothetical protein n=1 Tax=Mesorhizobium ventifaucium TaxID=666020 RepID=UPI0020A7152F|nr:hypothetical protein [Mesorhizobium ventifaucium]
MKRGGVDSRCSDDSVFYYAGEDGSVAVTMPFGRGNFTTCFRSRFTSARLRHRDQVYEGEREPIVTSATCEAAQALLASQAPLRRSQSNVTQPHLLTGLLFDEAGEKLRSGSCQQKGVRYESSEPNFVITPMTASSGR